MKQRLIFTLFGVMLLLALWNCKNQEKKPDMMMGVAGMAAAPNYATAEARFRSYCEFFPPPAGVTDTFTLSQNYPDSFDVNAAKPWMAFDFKKDYQNYMNAVLEYCMQGNVEVDFKVQNNNVRKWYSTPWMDNDGKTPLNPNKKQRQNSGREYWHGLTREIDLKPGILSATQDSSYQTYAVAFYNEPGGYTIGKVWKNASNPNINESDFPDGTVVFKLLFTEADTVQVPYLANAKKWKANIFIPSNEYTKRTDTDVRLLQLDIAVKDKRAKGFVEGEGQGIGWVYGTFVYDAAAKGKTWLERMTPLGLMWGDDSAVASMLNVTNKVNPDLKQSKINQNFVGAVGKAPNQGYVTHLGQGGRMNGPVDNPISSCISCHARAALTVEGESASMANFDNAGKYDKADFEKYFSTLECGVKPFKQANKNPDTGLVEIKDYTPADYSYQLAIGIRNFMHNEQVKATATSGKKMLKSAKPIKPIPMINRDGND